MTLTEALKALHEQGRIASPWLSGMLSTGPRGGFRFLCPGGPGHWVDPLRTGSFGDALRGEPDLSDPATVGCLLALLREASGNRGLVALLSCLASDGTWDIVWHTRMGICDFGGPPTAAASEGEALAAALIALAEAP